MSYYVYHPPADAVAKESLEFCEAILQRTTAYLDAADRSREATNQNYESAPAWQWGQVLDRVETTFENQQKLHNSTLAKLNWEKRADWAKTFPKPHVLAAPRPWLDDPAAWAKCFEHDNDDRV
jgi:hypothetical protein